MRFENIDLARLAARLIAARKSAGLTQEEAAKHLEISRPTFILIEKGSRRPKPSEIAKLSTLYKEPLNKLLRVEQEAPVLQPHLRSAMDSLGEGAPEVSQATSILASYVDDYSQLERLIDAQSISNFPQPVRVVPGSIERFAEHCAEEERARLDLGAHQPIHTLRDTLEATGIHIFSARLDSSIAGLYAFASGFGYCILVNRVHAFERRRWTIAHEYGHFLLERDKPGIDFSKPMQRKPEGERFADAFAAAFLMPEAGVQRRYYEEFERTSDFKVGDLCQMADYFSVSIMAMALRLEALGLIPRGSWDRIADSRVPLAAIKKEAGVASTSGADDSEAYPKRYKHLAVSAFLAEKISEGQLAKFLRCSRIEAREIVEECSEANDSIDATMAPFKLRLNNSLLVAA